MDYTKISQLKDRITFAFNKTRRTYPVSINPEDVQLVINALTDLTYILDQKERREVSP